MAGNKSAGFSELLSSFQFERILDSNTTQKTIVILGTIDSQPAIVALERLAFDAATIANQSVQSIVDLKNLQVLGNNDIYSWFKTLSLQDLAANPTNKLNLIYPATAKHISKYNKQKFHMVTETPETYRRVVRPYVESMKGDRIQWVKNILFHGAEADSVLYKDSDRETGFVLLPDMKWDGTTMENLYVVCIVNREDVSSVRDLNETHIEWLEGLEKRVLKIVPLVFGDKIQSDELRVFVHYQPSYYHFHVHVVNVRHDGLGNGISAGKAILLREVIDNLRFLGPEGYSKKSITYALGESHDLWKFFNQ